MADFQIFQGFKNFVEEYRRKNGENSISNSFAISMCKRLDDDFYNKTGIRISKSKGRVNFGPFFIKDLGYSFEDNVGVLKGNLGIEALIVGYDIKWRSKPEGKIIYPYDEIEEEEVEFWFDRVFVDTAKKKWVEIQTPIKLGIELNPLNYILNVENFTEHFYLVLNFYSLNDYLIDESERILNVTLRKWNEKSLGKDWELGVVHDYGVHRRDGTCLVYYIDGGSASNLLLKLILEMLNRVNQLEKVTITSYPDEE